MRYGGGRPRLDEERARSTVRIEAADSPHALSGCDQQEDSLIGEPFAAANLTANGKAEYDLAPKE